MTGIAAVERIDSEFRDLAVLLSVMQSLPDGDPQGDDRAPGAADRERQSVARHRARPDRRGQAQGGRPQRRPGDLQELADDLAAPQGLRARAAEMAAALKS